MTRFMGSFSVAAAFVLGHAATSHAESNEYNLHVGVGAYSGNDNGLGGFLGLDWQFKPGTAFDVSLAVAAGTGIDTEKSRDVAAMLGMRFRLFDDYRGYLNDPHGNAFGNLWFAPRVGLIRSDGTDLFGASESETTLAVSGEVGYEFSAFRPAQVGAFFRLDLKVVGDQAGNGSGFVLAGLSVSIGRGKPIRTYSDQDRDGVQDRSDACPDTPEGSEVDARGCTILRREMVLHGIQFRLDSADIEPSSERTLKQAAQALRDNPKAEVEIGGHTDNTGTDDHNLQLSRARAQSVADWLAANGIPRSQLTVKGYGSTVPKATNDSEDHRAQNRRIEFKRLDSVR